MATWAFFFLSFLILLSLILHRLEIFHTKNVSEMKNEILAINHCMVGLEPNAQGLVCWQPELFLLNSHRSHLEHHTMLCVGLYFLLSSAPNMQVAIHTGKSEQSKEMTYLLCKVPLDWHGYLHILPWNKYLLKK